MILHNGADCAVFVLINGKQITLQSNETIELSVTMPVSIGLRHFYGSSSMPLEKIRNDFMDASLVTALLSSNLPPYFTIVLNSTYMLQGDSNAKIEIKRQVIRPCYSCSYDRFYVQSDNAVVSAEYYDFFEKQQFIDLYKKASLGGFKTIIKILISVAFLLSLPMTLGIIVAMFNLHTALGVIGVIGAVLLYVGVVLFCNILFKIGRHFDIDTELDNFESKTIEGYFKKQ